MISDSSHSFVSSDTLYDWTLGRFCFIVYVVSWNNSSSSYSSRKARDALKLSRRRSGGLPWRRHWYLSITGRCEYYARKFIGLRLQYAPQRMRLRSSCSSAGKLPGDGSTCSPRSMIMLNALPAYNHDRLRSSHRENSALDIISNAWIVVTSLLSKQSRSSSLNR